MAKSAPISTLKLRETITRHPEIIEDGLTIVDSEFSVFDEPPLDLLGQDADGTMCLIFVRDQEQGTERGEHGGNIIEDAVFYWHMVTDFREDFISGIRKLTGKRVKRQPPRILILAPGYSDDLMNLAAFVNPTQAIELYQLSNIDSSPKATSVTVPEETNISAANKEAYMLQHGEKITTLAAQDKDFFESPKTHVYQPVSLDELVEKIGEEKRDFVKELIEKVTADGSLRSHLKANRIIFIDDAGLKSGELVIGPGGGFTTAVFAPDTHSASGIKQTEQFSPEDSERFLAELKKVAK